MPTPSDSIADWILNFDQVVPAAILELERIRQDTITPHEIEWALDDVLDLEEHNDLMKVAFDSEKIVALLRNYDFSRLRPEILGKVTFPGSILAPDVPVALNEEIVRFQGEVWMIHKNDADPFPSNPHAHNYETGYKLDLENGKLYLRKKLVGRLQPKRLHQFRERLKHIDLPILTIDAED